MSVRPRQKVGKRGRQTGSLRLQKLSIHYQMTTTEYDTTGNVIARNEKIDADRTSRTEYTYERGGS